MTDMFSPVGKTIAHLGFEKGIVTISKNKGKFYGLFDGNKIVESETAKKFSMKSVPVLSMVISNLCKNSDNKKITVKDSNSEFMGEILKTIRDNFEDVEILMLELKPDEQVENKPREVKATKDDILINRLSMYKKCLNKYFSNIQDVRKLADILLRTKFSSSMWGGKAVLGTISSIKSDLNDISKIIDSFDEIIERSGHKLEQIPVMIKNSKVFDISQINQSVKDTTNDFFNVKTIMSSTAECLYRLFDIDKQFKEQTGYPTTWFFNSSIFYDFIYSFENLIKNLMESSRIESFVIEPLFVWKIRTIGDSKCQTI